MELNTNGFPGGEEHRRNKWWGRTLEEFMVVDAPPDTLVSKRRTWGDKKSEFVLEQEHYGGDIYFNLFCFAGKRKVYVMYMLTFSQVLLFLIIHIVCTFVSSLYLGYNSLNFIASSKPLLVIFEFNIEGTLGIHSIYIEWCFIITIILDLHRKYL